MKNNAEISLIIPVYNVEDYLAQCLDSVLVQSFQDMEILIIDDGSTDGSGEICDAYADCDERISVFHTANHGLAAARNYGLDRMHGKYVAFLDSDDWIEEGAIQLLYDALESTDADIAVCACYQEYYGKSIKDVSCGNKLILDGREGLASYLYDTYIGAVVWNKMYKTELFDDIRYPEGRIYEDIAVMYKLIEAAKRVTVIPERLIHYRIRAGSLSRDCRFKHLKDHWLSIIEKYEYISQNYPEYNDAVIGSCIGAIFRTWRLYHGCSEADKQAAGPVLDQMQEFVAQHRKRVLSRGSSFSWIAKLGCICAKYRNPAVFVILYWVNQLYRKIKRGKAYK